MTAKKEWRHFVKDIHWATKSEARSWILCNCGEFMYADNDLPIAGHDALASQWLAHQKSRAGERKPPVPKTYRWVNNLPTLTVEASA